MTHTQSLETSVVFSQAQELAKLLFSHPQPPHPDFRPKASKPLHMVAQLCGTMVPCGKTKPKAFVE